MRMLDRFADLRHELQPLARVQLMRFGIFQQRLAADELHGEMGLRAESAIGRVCLMDLRNAGVLQTAERFRFPLEAPQQRGIIHCDLKPSNILVEESGQPKILDFGVARVTDSDVQTTRQTDVGQIVGTLGYMSPEQVFGDPLQLDTRSDVYSLGVILFELLAGCLPYQLSRHLHEAVRTIREEEPTRLNSVSYRYRGDLETIVWNALEEDKARRYASAANLASNLQRYLKDEPITARSPGTTYQKFARWNKVLVARAIETA
jgi:eukaryotic-like serine/threonine-protein kinase